MAEDLRLAHEAGTLEGGAGGWCRWLCDCGDCTALLAAEPARLIVLKCSGGRAIVTAGELAERGADALAEGLGLGYVREVFTAERPNAVDLGEVYRPAVRDRELEECGGAYDGVGAVYSDADPGL